jgi:hypothetical protein
MTERLHEIAFALARPRCVGRVCTAERCLVVCTAEMSQEPDQPVGEAPQPGNEGSPGGKGEGGATLAHLLGAGVRSKVCRVAAAACAVADCTDL